MSGPVCSHTATDVDHGLSAERCDLSSAAHSTLASAEGGGTVDVFASVDDVHVPVGQRSVGPAR